ncbi:HAMP domain-containing protein [candidate division WOR-3 bacterium]|nr:HAMP domain-containing protein [candidate division WOR-3 bacterium]
MKKSFFFKIFFGYFFIIFLLSFLFLVSTFKTIRNSYIDILTGNLKNLGITLRLKIIPLLEENHFEELDTLIKKLGRNINTRITVIDPRGVVLADSEKDPELMENHKNRPEIRDALNGETGKSLRFSTTVKGEMLYVAVPVEKDKRVLGILRVSLFLKDINILLGNIRSRIIQIALIAIIISLSGATLFSKGLSNPIKELVRGARKVAFGDFDVKIYLRNRDELKELADAFNYMTHKIKTLFSDLSFRKGELDSIISSLQQGLLVLDKDGKIVLSNESSQKILQNNNIEGKLYWEVIREPKLSDLIKRVADEKGSLVGEVEFNEKTFVCSAIFIAAQEEIVLIFHDITEIRNLEKVKKDFVVNVSHELRTPLTAIKGFVETLEDEVNKKHIHYLEIIKKHTERLINIVEDLLLLSEFEEKKAKLEIEEVNLNSLVENVQTIFNQKIKEKGLTLELNRDKEIPIIKADPFKLEQLFINLIDNAINYTEKGKIRLSLTRENQYLKIEIEDTGIGIPHENLPRIFERFYVVDKSRSRKLGGTGLGLSIVKHIVLLHNGKIDVESTYGKGTKFKIILPVSPS